MKLVPSEQMKSDTTQSVFFNCQYLAPQPSLQVGSGSSWATSLKSPKEILSLSHKLLVSGRVCREVSNTLVLILISFAGLWFWLPSGTVTDGPLGWLGTTIATFLCWVLLLHSELQDFSPDPFQINRIAFCINTQD